MRRDKTIRMLLAMAALLSLSGPARAQEGSEGAEAFVRAVYASYTEEADATPLMDRDPPLIWSDRMAALIDRDIALSGDELPFLDADPICSCQDWENLRVLDVRIDRERGVRGRRATVRFVNAGEEQTAILRLSGSPFEWRIDDVLNPGYLSLAEQLAASNARLEAGGKALGRD
jgi:hypothetical protein